MTTDSKRIAELELIKNRKFTATGAISTGNRVGLLDDGTVEVLPNTADQTQSGGSGIVFESGDDTRSVCSVYEPVQNKVVVAYVTWSGSIGTGKCVIGTVSGSTISFSSPIVWDTNVHPGASGDREIDICYDSNSQCIAIVYKVSPNTYVIAGTVSGNTISFGTRASAGIIGYSSRIAFYPPTDQIVITYSDSAAGNSALTRAGTISGTTISFPGPETNLGGTDIYTSDLEYDPYTQKLIFAHGGNGASTCHILRVSSNTVISDNSNQFANIGYHISVAIDTKNNAFIIAYKLSTDSKFYVRVGTISGTTITLGDPVLIHNRIKGSDMSAIFDSFINKIVISYSTEHPPWSGTVIEGEVSAGGTVATNTITFGSEFIFHNKLAQYNSGTFHPIENKCILLFSDLDNSGFGTALYYTPAGTYSFGAALYFGIAGENISDGDTGKIKVIADLADGQSGLTVNAYYYIADDGTLTTTDTGNALVGRAVSSTEIFLTNEV
jgi:hypothetical protein